MKLNLDHPVRNSQDLALAEIESMNRNWIRAVEGYRADFWMGMLVGIAFSMGAIFAVFAWILSA